MKIFKIIVLNFISFYAHAQIIIFEGQGPGDNPFKRPIDTVIFGFSNGASLGIDPSYGEENIKDKPTDSLELRVVQRSKLNHNCLVDTSNNNIYFPEDLELRKDIRSLNSKGNECYFEVVNLTDNFTEGFVINLSKFHTASHKSTYLAFSAISECGRDTVYYSNILKGLDSSTFIGSILLYPGFILDTGYRNYKHFYFHLKPDFSNNANETNSEESLIKAFPNPANNYIIIECEEAIEIMDIKGNILFSFPRQDEKRIVDLSLLPIGTYIISKTNSFGKTISHTKFMKI
ncbi:MAG: T9SS type A sorting domain-containing protein [Saprospiraceae bacterium]